MSAFYHLLNEPRLDYEALSGCFFGETLAKSRREIHT